MPDALSKTVPIWCAVINRLLFEEDTYAGKLFTPKEIVGKSEHVQIEARIDGFVEEAKVCISSMLISSKSAILNWS